jgi:hypothetical protein
MGVEKPDSSQDEHFKNRCIGFGLGASKKEGEQAAAKMALINYGVLKEDQYTKADLYYPPWSLIDNHDGESLILSKNDDDINQETNNDDYNTNQNDDETCSVYSNVSKKSLEL